MIFHQIEAGGDRNFSYLIGEAPGGAAALFDPPPSAYLYQSLIERHGLKLEYIVVTHGHSDHTWGVSAAKEATGARVVAHALSPLQADIRVKDGDELDLGTLRLFFIHTPGHTDDSMCILAGDKLITGDTLFVGKVGGTDDEAEARKEYESLNRKLMKLADAIEVWPGHDYGVARSSTIGHERTTNPFLLRESFAEFVHLKHHWLQFKKEHGIS